MLSLGCFSKKNTNFTNKVCKSGLIKVCKNRPFFERVYKFSSCLKRALIEFVANESKHISMFFYRAVISSATRTHPLQSLTEVSA